MKKTDIPDVWDQDDLPEASRDSNGQQTGDTKDFTSQIRRGKKKMDDVLADVDQKISNDMYFCPPVLDRHISTTNQDSNNMELGAVQKGLQSQEKKVKKLEQNNRRLAKKIEQLETQQKVLNSQIKIVSEKEKNEKALTAWKSKMEKKMLIQFERKNEEKSEVYRKMEDDLKELKEKDRRRTESRNVKNGGKEKFAPQSLCSKTVFYLCIFLMFLLAALTSVLFNDLILRAIHADDSSNFHYS